MIRRSLFTFLAAISFVLFAAVVTLAIRATRHADFIGTMRGTGDPLEFSGIYSTPRGIWIGRWVIDDVGFIPTAIPTGWMWNREDSDSVVDQSRRFDAGWGQLDPESWQWRAATKKDYFIKAPHWAFAIVLAIAPLAWLVALRKRQRIKRRGGCRICGYDLRATPERCPECGAMAHARV